MVTIQHIGGDRAKDETMKEPASILEHPITQRLKYAAGVRGFIPAHLLVGPICLSYLSDAGTTGGMR